MRHPLQLLIGRESLRNRIRQESLMLRRERKHLQEQAAQLKQSAVKSATSPLALAGTAVLGFLAGRKMQTPPAPPATTETRRSKQPSLLLELLLPVGFAWARHFAISHLQARETEGFSPYPEQ